MNEKHTIAYNEPIRTELRDFSDPALTRLFAKQHAGVLRYCPEWGFWVVFEERRWRRDTKAAIRRLAEQTLAFIDILIDGVADPHDKYWVDARRKRCGFFRAVEAVMGLAKSEPSLIAHAEAFDQNKHLLNFLNGTIDLTTGILRPHLRADYLTHMMAIEYHPDPSLSPEAGLRQWCRRLGMNADSCRTRNGFTQGCRPPEFDPGLLELEGEPPAPNASRGFPSPLSRNRASDRDPAATVDGGSPA